MTNVRAVDVLEYFGAFSSELEPHRLHKSGRFPHYTGVTWTLPTQRLSCAGRYIRYPLPTPRWTPQRSMRRRLGMRQFTA